MHNRKNLSLFILSSVFLLIVPLLIFSGHIQAAGIFLVSAFITLSFAIIIFPALRGFSYTLWIFAAVTASMFYPQYFISIGSFQLKSLIVPLLQIIMFGMGSQMSANDFAGIIKMPKGVIIGILLQFTLMPLVGFTLARLFNFPAEIAAGIILIGCVPSGLASNVMSFLARANLALAVTLSSVTTVLSPLVTPFLMKTLAGQYIEVNFWSMMLDILNMIILPVVAGFIFNLVAKRNASRKSTVIQIIVFISVILITTLVYTKSAHTGFSGFVFRFLKSAGWFLLLPAAGALILSKYLKGDNRIMEQVLSFFSMAGIAVIITIITASGRESLLNVGLLLLIASLLHNLTGYTLGYFFAWLSGMPERDRRTIAFEVGMQNGGLASGLALQMGKLATVGLAPAIFGPLMNITGSILANWWRRREDEQMRR